MTFKEKYLNWKMEGKTDQEIADILKIHRSTLFRLKKIHDVPAIIIRKNMKDVPEQQLRIGVMNGLTRRLILRRVREYNWSILDAIHLPRQVKRRKQK